MKQNFDKIIHKRFIDYFKIKNTPSEVEKIFYDKTIKYIKYIKWNPGLKMIGIGNSISMNCANSNSDIDLLIITSPNSMWLNRIIVTLIFQILMVRKTTKKHASRFCLSFFATTDGMDFSNWKIENDVYLYFWIVYFKPILNYDNTYELFLEKNTSWADFGEYSDIIEDNKKYVKYKIPLSISPQRITETGVLARLSSKLERSREEATKWSTPFSPGGKGWYRGIGFLNNLLKKIFLPKTLKHYENIGKPYGVIINDDLLKFHNGDIRIKIKEDIIR